MEDFPLAALGNVSGHILKWRMPFLDPDPIMVTFFPTLFRPACQHTKLENHRQCGTYWLQQQT
jgi:hypothetical protein